METIARHRQDYKIQIKRMRDLNLNSNFFIPFIEYYSPYYMEWFHKKHNDPVFIVEDEGYLKALMKLKLEDESEDYSDISPIFRPKIRLKLSSLRVEAEGAGIGSELMKVALTTAANNNAKEIYATLPSIATQKAKTITFLEKHGFKEWGNKESHGIVENVFVRPVNISDKDISVAPIFIEFNSLIKKEEQM